MLMTTFLLVAAAGLAAGTCLRLRPRHSGPEKFLHFRCAECGQKVRYLATKAGRPGMCPRCRQRWTLPTVAQPVARAERRVQVGARKVPA
jgi:DNA-directed RNA polymerase subunit RPC12/RpoP